MTTVLQNPLHLHLTSETLEIVEEIEEVSCRICLETEPEDDLFSPCLCNGTMKYVHRSCLQQWRLSTINPHFITHCSHCLYPYQIIRSSSERVRDKIFQYKNYFIFWFIRKCIDLLLFIYIYTVFEKSKRQLMYPSYLSTMSSIQIDLCYIQLFTMTMCGIINWFVASFHNNTVSEQLRVIYSKYKKQNMLMVTWSVGGILIVPSVSICVTSLVIDQWLWFQVVCFYKYSTRFRPVGNREMPI